VKAFSIFNDPTLTVDVSAAMLDEEIGATARSAAKVQLASEFFMAFSLLNARFVMRLFGSRRRPGTNQAFQVRVPP
jgi:hypothetical protein